MVDYSRFPIVSIKLLPLIVTLSRPADQYSFSDICICRGEFAWVRPGLGVKGWIGDFRSLVKRDSLPFRRRKM
jgi:hypothetical protein